MTSTLSAQKLARIALVGNPNVGKTSLFNAMTGLSARVGNYAGVTVEKRVGTLKLGERSVEVVDLPGIYTLAPHSLDEVVAFSVLTEQTGDPPLDGLVVVLDASNLERNLYLFSQALALGRPIAVALTMMDVAASQQVAIDVAWLQERLGVPVAVVNAARRTGLDDLNRAIETMLAGGVTPTPGPDLGPVFASEVEALRAWMEAQGRAGWSRFLLERALIDQGGHVERVFEETTGPEGRERLEAARARLRAEPVPAAHEARARYQWVHERLADVQRRPETPVTTLSDRIDAVLTHPVLGLVVFATLMVLIFQSIYTWSAPLMDLIDALFKQLGALVGSWMPDGALKSLIVDGAISGVGSVVMFLPQIAILFLFIHLLEDCGYMARAAFLMDRIMSKAGLSGKSFIPMLSGFACAVPSVMATRTIENRRDRLATILALPLMSCSARLPVYTIMIGVAVPAVSFHGLDARGLALFAIYLMGIAFAIPLIWVLKRTVLRDETPTLVMEMPSYKLPGLGVVAIGVGRKCWAFLEQAGTVILCMAVLIWAAAYFPHRAEVAAPLLAQKAAVTAQAAPDSARLARLDAEIGEAYIEDSYLARVGKAVQPAFAPLGWDWRITTGVLASFPAREVIVATLGTLYSLGDEAEGGQLQATLKAAKNADGSPAFGLAVGLSVMVFFALCLQCFSTLSVMWRETGSWKWPALAFTFQSGLAYVCALVVYQLLKGV